MNEMAEPSMYEPERPEWPLHAVPEAWVDRLFAVMSAAYGARFADLWRGSNLADVRRLWGIELFRLTREQLKAGRENLTALPKPPTLPEFIIHCKQARLDQSASAVPRLENLPKATPEQATANLERINRAVAGLRTPKITAEWAFKAVMRGKSVSGLPLSFSVANCATDAITSSAGKRVIDECIDPELKKEYAAIRQTIVDNYRMRGMRLWDVK
jgi:hypothetical protein